MLYNKKLLSICFVEKKKQGEGWAEGVALVLMGKRSQKCMFPVENLI